MVSNAGWTDGEECEPNRLMNVGGSHHEIVRGDAVLIDDRSRADSRLLERHTCSE